MKGPISIVENLENDYKEVIITGILNARSMEWGISSNNACGALLQNWMHTLNLSCVNDDQPIRRESDRPFHSEPTFGK